jgi:hypothetical protein
MMLKVCFLSSLQQNSAILSPEKIIILGHQHPLTPLICIFYTLISTLQKFAHQLLTNPSQIMLNLCHKLNL